MITLAEKMLQESTPQMEQTADRFNQMDGIDKFLTSYLDTLNVTTNPDMAVRLCREIYTVGSTKHPADDILRAIERRLPAVDPEKYTDCEVCTNAGVLIISKPLGQIGNSIIYTNKDSDGGVYFGRVTYSKSWKPQSAPWWDVMWPDSRRENISKEA